MTRTIPYADVWDFLVVELPPKKSTTTKQTLPADKVD